jgi:hypothetical protein
MLYLGPQKGEIKLAAGPRESSNFNRPYGRRAKSSEGKVTRKNFEGTISQAIDFIHFNQSPKRSRGFKISASNALFVGVAISGEFNSLPIAQ